MAGRLYILYEGAPSSHLCYDEIVRFRGTRGIKRWRKRIHKLTGLDQIGPDWDLTVDLLACIAFVLEVRENVVSHVSFGPFRFWFLVPYRALLVLVLFVASHTLE